jgi:hypothetical protein
MKKILLILFSCTLLSGCVGAVGLYPKSVAYKAPFARNTSYSDSTGELRSTKTSTQEAFLQEWGKPSHKELSADTECWIYHQRNEVCGVVLGVVIPIPLVLPVCSSEDRICFKNGAASSITVRQTTEGGIMCGLFVNGFHGGPDLCTK